MQMKPKNARVHDLIAKTARVTVKDTVRVMFSMQVVANHLGCTMDEMAALHLTQAVRHLNRARHA